MSYISKSPNNKSNYYIIPNTENSRNHLLLNKCDFIFSYNNLIVATSSLLNLYDFLSYELKENKDQLRIENEGTDEQKGNSLIEQFKSIKQVEIKQYERYFIEGEMELLKFPKIIYLDDVFKEKFVEKIIISGDNPGGFIRCEENKQQIIEITQTSFRYDEKEDYLSRFIFDEKGDHTSEGKVSINRNYLWAVDFNSYQAEKKFVELSIEFAEVFKENGSKIFVYDGNVFEVKVIFEDGLELSTSLSSSFEENGYTKIAKMLKSYFPKMVKKPIYLE